MSTGRVNFNLRSSKAKTNERTIRVIIRWDNNKLVRNTGHRVNKNHWKAGKDDRGRKLAYKDQGVKLNAPGISPNEKKRLRKLDSKLSAIEEMIDNIFEGFEDTTPSKAEIEALLDAATSTEAKEKEEPITLVEYIEETMMSRTFNKGGTIKKIEPGTKANYKQMADILSDYEEHTGKTLYFHSITDEFYTDFITWMQGREVRGRTDGTRGHTANAIGKTVRNLKATMRHALNNKKITELKELPYNPDEFKAAKEESLDIALTLDELESMYELTFNKDEQHLETARDLFVFACWCGLRYSDVMRINDEGVIDRDKGTLKITTQKTGKLVTVPLLDPMPQILDKHDGKLPEMSNPEINRYIKRVAERIEDMDDKVEVYTKTVGGESQTIRKDRFNMVTMHSSRRTYATIMVHHFKVNPLSVMKLTGHRQLKTFENYIKLNDEQVSDEIAITVNRKRNGS